VRNAADQRPKAFQPLAAEKLLLQLFLLGDVGFDAQDGLGMALFITDKRRADLDDDLFAALGEFPQFTHPFPGGLQGFLLGGKLRRRRLVKKHFQDVAAQGLLLGPAIDAAGALVPKGDLVLRCGNDDGVPRLVEQRGLFMDFLLGGLAPAHVNGHADHPLRPAGTVDDRRPVKHERV